jgi:hypothetical protein
MKKPADFRGDFRAKVLDPQPARIWIEGELGEYAQLNGVALSLEEAERMWSQLDRAITEARRSAR